MLHSEHGFSSLASLSTMLNSESTSASSQRPTGNTSSDLPTLTARSSVPLAHALPDGDPSLMESPTMLPGTIDPDADDRHQAIGSVQCLSRRWSEHTVHHLNVQDPHIAANVEPFANPLQRMTMTMLHSPIARLPPEMLTYIFELYLSTPVLASIQGPSRLARVCKLWKAVAESDPRLWTSIHIYLPIASHGRKEDVARVKHVFDVHLKRSGALPLSFTFADHRCYHAATEDLVSLVVDRLRAHSRRWKYISLHMSCGYFPRLFTFMPCNLSSLEHLCISGDVLGQRIVAALHMNLESATNLKSFAYSGPGHSLGDRIDVHWERLADLSFEFAPHNGVSSTLSGQFWHLAQCQNLTTCSLGVDRPFWLDSDESITLPSLRTLRVRQLSAQSHARTVIDPLILPRLDTLEIDAAVLLGSGGRHRSWHDRNFSNLLARSGCALRRLSIQNVDFPNEELVRCLALSPTLVAFRFVPCPRSQDMVDVIRQLDVSDPVATRGRKHVGDGDSGGDGAGDGPLAPRLREITLASSMEGHLDPMMRMFRSRVGACAHAAQVVALRHVEVVLGDMAHCDSAGARGHVPGDPEGRVTGFREELARWVSENERGGGVDEDEEERLEASVTVECP